MTKKISCIFLAIICSIACTANTANKNLNSPSIIRVDFTFSPELIFVNTNVRFMAVVNGNKSGFQFKWYWGNTGDSTITNDYKTLHKFPTAGAYTIKLVVENASHERDSVFETVIVMPVPDLTLHADFSIAPPTIYEGTTILPFDASVCTFGYITSYEWQIPLGSTWVTTSPYSELNLSLGAGSYPAMLVVTNNSGRTDTMRKIINVLPPHQVKEKLCPGETITLSTSVNEGTFHWQIKSDSTGYHNITNNSFFSGADSNELTITAAPSSWSGYKIKCVAGDNSVTDKIFTLSFENSFNLSHVSSEWENPANWTCGILPDSNTDVVIPAGISVILNSNAICRSVSVLPGGNITVNPGFTLSIAH